MPWGRRGRKPCRAAAGADSLGEGILQGGEALCLQGPGSGRCSPAGPQEVPVGRSGTGFLGGIPLSLEEEAEEGSWAGCPAQAACWGVGVRWGLVGQGGTEEAAWSDGQSHRDLKCEEEEKIRKKKTGRRGITNRKSRGRTMKERNVRSRACYLTRALLYICLMSYLSVEEGKTITQTIAPHQDFKKHPQRKKEPDIFQPEQAVC